MVPTFLPLDAPPRVFASGFGLRSEVLPEAPGSCPERPGCGLGPCDREAPRDREVLPPWGPTSSNCLFLLGSCLGVLRAVAGADCVSFGAEEPLPIL